MHFVKLFVLKLFVLACALCIVVFHFFFDQKIFNPFEFLYRNALFSLSLDGKSLGEHPTGVINLFYHF